MQSDAADFRANWQRLLTSLEPLKDFTEPLEGLSDTFLSAAANKAESVVIRSIQGHPGRAPENEAGLAEEARLQFPTAPADSSLSRLALRIGPRNATNVSIGGTSGEKSIRQKVQSPDSEVKADDGDVRSTRRKSLTLLACAQTQAEPPFVTDIPASTIPLAFRADASKIPSYLIAQSDGLSEGVGTSLSGRAANQVSPQAASPGFAAFGNPAGEPDKEVEESTVALLPANPAATADSDANISAVVPRALHELKTEHADIPASDRSSTDDNQRFPSGLLQDAGGDATVSSPPGKQNHSHPTALHSAGSSETSQHRMSTASSRKAEATPGNLAGAHASSMHAAHTDSAQPRAFESPIPVADAIRDPSTILRAGLPGRPFQVDPAHQGDSSPAGRDLFAALDSDGASLSSASTRGTHHAEAGFQDPQMGWVIVRAHAESNGVHASLVPGSADAAQSLAGHLEGLSAYLANHAPVQSLTISPAETRWPEQSPGQPMDHGTAEGSRQERQSGTGADADPSTGQATFASPSVQRKGGIELPAATPREGRYISVVA